MLAHFYTFSTWEAKVEAGGSMSSGQTGYVVRTLSQAVPPPIKTYKQPKQTSPPLCICLTFSLSTYLLTDI